MKVKRTLALLLFTALPALPALAAEGRREIFQPIVLDGNLSDIGGKYFVSRNIVGTTASPVIAITGTGTETIDIDLNGFALTSTVGPAEVIAATNVRDLTIRNGSLIGPANSDLLVVVGGANLSDKLVAEDLRLSGGRIGIWVFTTENLIVKNNVIAGADRGIVLQGNYGEPPLTGVLEGNIFRELAGSALSIDDVSANVLIAGNQAEGVGGLVFFVDESRGTRIVGNTVSTNGVAAVAGIVIRSSTGCIITENSVTQVGSNGIGLVNTNACRVEANVVSDADSGLALDGSSGNLVRGNVSRGNAFAGLWLFGESDHNKVDSNTLTDNTSYGLRFDSTAGGNSYSGNLSRSNGGVGCPVAGTPTCGDPDFCDAGTGNTSLGDNLLPGPPPC